MGLYMGRCRIHCSIHAASLSCYCRTQSFAACVSFALSC
jgi:hypothetical protein